MTLLVRSWWWRFGLYLLCDALWLGALFHGVLNTPQWSPYLLTHPAVLVLYNIVSQSIVEAVPVVLAWLLLVRPDRLTIINSGRSLRSIALGVGLAFLIILPLAGWIAGVPRTEGLITWVIPGLASLAVAIGEEYTARFAVWSSLMGRVGVKWGAVGATGYFVLGHAFELWRNYQSYVGHALWPAVGAPLLEGILPLAVVTLWVVWRSGSLIPAIGMHWAGDWLPWQAVSNFVTMVVEVIPLLIGIMAAEAMVWGSSVIQKRQGHQLVKT